MLKSFLGSLRGRTSPATADAPAPAARDVFYNILFLRTQTKLFRDIGTLKADFAFADGQSEVDDAIIDRVIAAYRSQDGALSTPSAVWDVIFSSRLRPIHELLMTGGRDEIAALLRNPADADLFYGFDGTVPDFVRTIKANAPESGAVAKLAKDHLLRLVEITGALPFEAIDNPDPTMNPDAYGAMEPEDILAALDRRLGTALRFPNLFAGEHGLATPRGVISYQVPQALYHAWRVSELVKGIANPRVLEIGGGLGRAANFAWQLGVRDYTIVDLPMTGLCQGYFLMRTLGADNVRLRGEANGREGRIVKLIHPADFIDDHESRYDLILNANSITEMSREVADGYWNCIAERTPLFLSINHESNPFTVREMADADAGRVLRSTRHAYGLRKSYAEETFAFRL